jgi:hypothetical protein
MKYDKEYFIKKFEAIPDNEIGALSIENHCALHHCGVEYNCGGYKKTDEALALLNLFGNDDTDEPDWSRVYDINDGNIGCYGGTPKERILNKLKSL